MEKSKKILIIAFSGLLIIVLIISVIGIIMLGDEPVVLQGDIEATEVRISGMLPGRVEEFLVQEGDSVKKGDTLVVISCPQAEAKYQEVAAMREVAVYQNQKIDDGTRKQIIETAKQMWIISQSDLKLASITYERTQRLFADSVVTSQRLDEVKTLYESAVANEKAAHQQYELALAGAQKQDKESAKAMVNAAGGVVGQVTAVLKDAHLTAPEDGLIANIYPKRGELVGTGTPIMNLVVIAESHAVINIREDYMPYFKSGEIFHADIPALALKEVPFKIYFISPLGSYATWKSTKQAGSFDMRTFQIKAKPTKPIKDLRPGMSVLVTLKEH